MCILVLRPSLHTVLLPSLLPVLSSPERLCYLSPVGVKTSRLLSFVELGRKGLLSKQMANKIFCFQPHLCLHFQRNLVLKTLETFESLWCESGCILAFLTLGSVLLNQLFLFLYFLVPKFSFPILTAVLGLCCKNHFIIALVWFGKEIKVSIDVQSAIFNGRSSLIIYL